jgi:DNA-binding transcriptional ArsR family regulator
MLTDPNIARVAQAIGDPTRIRMLSLLMQGQSLTAKELAYGAGVEPATGTVHLRRLMDESLVTARTQGRHKYFRLASPQVAHCIESLMTIAKPIKDSQSEEVSPIRLARFCYDHLAGRLAIEIVQRMLALRLLRAEDGAFVVTRKGVGWLDGLGIDVEQIAKIRRKFAPFCLDWTERKDHLGGALGATLANRMLEKGWVVRKTDSRVATVTRDGARALRLHFGIRWNQN